MKLLTEDLHLSAPEAGAAYKEWTPTEATARLLFDVRNLLRSIRRIGLFFVWIAIIGFIGTLIAISAAH